MIGDALDDPATSLEELVAHRDHAAAILAMREDLEAALERIETEIDRRRGGTP